MERRKLNGEGGVVVGGGGATLLDCIDDTQWCPYCREQEAVDAMAVQCAEGYEGPICGSCKHGYARKTVYSQTVAHQEIHNNSKYDEAYFS